jgi:hypothetical protein
MKRRIVEVGGAIALCLATYLCYSIASSMPALSLAQQSSDIDATFSDLGPDRSTFPAWRVKWPELRTFCAGLCTDEDLMR